ncbi:hypothetical protein N7451_003084 [Penicillium sp. IBT 35674x]|nr:hypothetical protein N7451_003084 [Penicillium sp. IBT 35674x]
MSLPTSLQNLKELPSRAVDDNSTFPEGRYVVNAPKPKDESDPLLSSEGPGIVTKTWFKSPSVQLFADTHDQGWVDDRALGNWTWLEVAIYENESSDYPRTREGVELVWMSHKNDMGSEQYDWVGNVIGVRVCARFIGWKLFGRAACLVLDMGRPTAVEQPPSYAQVMEDTLALQQILNAVNSNNNAYGPTITAAWDRADTFSGKEKRPLRVLSLDGGGVRGYSSLMLLKEVMDKGAPNKKPCEVFDLIGGTSTGGLIAIMLGRLKMTVQECLDEYSALMKEVFGSGWFHDYVTKPTRYATTGAFYSAETLEKVIKALLRKKLPAGEDADNALLLDDKENPCKIFLMAVREEAGNNRGPVFLRSYTNDLEVPDADLAKIKLWEAARATSAAPAYFKPLEVGRMKLVDGGLLANNPLGWLWTEVLGVYGPTRETDCFLSIGTGMASNVAVAQPGFNFKGAMMSFASIATNTESTHLLFRYLVDAFAPSPQVKKYWRLNVAKEKEGSNPKDYEDPGQLDAVAEIEKLKGWTKEWIAAQLDVIKPCSEAIEKSLL